MNWCISSPKRWNKLVKNNAIAFLHSAQFTGSAELVDNVCPGEFPNVMCKLSQSCDMWKLCTFWIGNRFKIGWIRNWVLFGYFNNRITTSAELSDESNLCPREFQNVTSKLSKIAICEICVYSRLEIGLKQDESGIGCFLAISAIQPLEVPSWLVDQICVQVNFQISRETYYKSWHACTLWIGVWFIKGWIWNLVLRAHFNHT